MKPPRSDRPRTGAPAGPKPTHKPGASAGAPRGGKPSYGKPSYAGGPDKPRGAQGRSSYAASSEKPNYSGGKPSPSRSATPRPAPARGEFTADPGERPVRTRRPASGFKAPPYTGPRPESADDGEPEHG